MTIRHRTPYSGKYAADAKPDLQFDLVPSRAYSRLSLSIHGLCLLVILLSSLPILAKLLVSLFVGVSACLCFFAALRNTNLRWEPNDRIVWSLKNADNTVLNSCGGLPNAGCYQCWAFVVLCIKRTPDSLTGTTQSILIPRDSVSCAEFRALRSRITLLDVSRACG